MMPGDIAARKDLGICPPEARARVTALQQALDAALREVLLGMHTILDEGIEAQVVRW